MEVKLDTMRRRLRIAAKHSEQVNAVLLKELKVSQVELDALWSFVKKTIFAAGRTSGGRSLDRDCLCHGVQDDDLLLSWSNGVFPG